MPSKKDKYWFGVALKVLQYFITIIFGDKQNDNPKEKRDYGNKTTWK